MIRARLWGSLESRSIDGDQAECRLISGSPFEIVEQRPVEITEDGHAVPDGAQQPGQCAVDIADALLVILRVDTILGHADRLAGLLMRVAHHVSQTRRIKFVAASVPLGFRGRRYRSFGVDERTTVVLHASEIAGLPDRL